VRLTPICVAKCPPAELPSTAILSGSMFQLPAWPWALKYRTAHLTSLMISV
tara:strand:- start:97186 stop:97338 length:153 start_codon:yes stop_codon:yes gene_type:complete